MKSATETGSSKPARLKPARLKRGKIIIDRKPPYVKPGRIIKRTKKSVAIS